MGPHRTLLADRVALPPPVWSNPFAMQMEGIARAEARRERAIYLSQKNRVPRKPEAPVEPLPKCKTLPRTWKWIGEAIHSKGILPHGEYTTEQIRKAGFKLPKIGGKKK